LAAERGGEPNDGRPRAARVPSPSNSLRRKIPWPGRLAFRCVPRHEAALASATTETAFRLAACDETVRAAIAWRQLPGRRGDRQTRRRRDSDVDHMRAMTLGPLRAEGAGHIVASDDRVRNQARRLPSRIALGDDGRWIANGCR
jgi:hypothetical protein